MNEPLVSVVIPTHNRRAKLLRLVESILESNYSNIEIIIVDDASSDGTYEYVRNKFQKNDNIKIIRNKKNLFTAETRNVGQEKSRGEYILFVDDDNVLARSMIREMVKVFEQDSRVGEVGPINYSFKEKNKIIWAGTQRNMLTTKTYHLKSVPNSNEIWETPDVPNAFMVRKQIVQNRIKFKEFYGIMYEESDYACRIHELGYKIMVARKASIFHDAEEYTKNGKTKDYMFHFMEDKRRPFVFARNRIVFHSLYSTKIQNFFILFFWIWFFAGYYIYKFISYDGYGKFSLADRIRAASGYLKGTIAGIKFALYNRQE